MGWEYVLPLYAELLKHFDQVKVKKILYVQKYLNNNLRADTLNTLRFEKINHFCSIGCNQLDQVNYFE